MKVNQATYDRFWEKGWVVIEGVFSHDRIDAVTEHAMQIGDETLRDDPESRYKVDRSEDGELAPRKIQQPFLVDEFFHSFVLDPGFMNLIQDLVGKPPLLVTDQIFMKPPRFGTAKAYHQDNGYFLCDPGGEVITAWIALDDVDEENGCLRYIDSSHREGVLPHTKVPGVDHDLAPSPELIDLSRESLACVKKGGVVFHHSEALHGSHRNESDRWRRAYATHWATADVTCDSAVIDNAYFKRDDYPVHPQGVLGHPSDSE